MTDFRLTSPLLVLLLLLLLLRVSLGWLIVTVNGVTQLGERVGEGREEVEGVGILRRELQATLFVAK